jgi:acetyl-CoA carboxylase carboxyl transferase subunit alpha
MLKNKLIDGIIREPLGGAHANREEASEILKSSIVQMLNELKEVPVPQLVSQRIEKFCSMGVVQS